jgi:hypothetical protein
LKKLIILLTLLSPLANADDIFSEAWDWAKDNPEISIPSAVVGIPGPLVFYQYHYSNIYYLFYSLQDALI